MDNFWLKRRAKAIKMTVEVFSGNKLLLTEQYASSIIFGANKKSLFITTSYHKDYYDSFYSRNPPSLSRDEIDIRIFDKSVCVEHWMLPNVTYLDFSKNLVNMEIEISSAFLNAVDSSYIH